MLISPLHHWLLLWLGSVTVRMPLHSLEYTGELGWIQRILQVRFRQTGLTSLLYLMQIFVAGQGRVGLG